MKQETILGMENECRELENAMKAVRDNLKDIKNGGNMTNTSFNMDLNSLIEAVENLQSRIKKK